MTQIVQFWRGKVPSDIIPLVDTWKTLNPDSSYILFDDQSAEDFMRQQFSAKLHEAFCKITIPAMKSDVFRVAYVLVKGGLYVDCATKCLRPVRDWISEDTPVMVMQKNNGFIWNGFIYAKAENPYLGQIWKTIEKNLINYEEGNIWALTGPGVFIAEYNKLDDSYKINFKPQNEMKKHFEIVNSLKHKAGCHWSHRQNIQPLFEQNNVIELVNSYENLEQKHLLIHMGMHKTTSTALQQKLHSENDNGFYYPKVGKRYSGHHDLINLLSTQNEEITNQTKTDFWAECANTEFETIIISSEFLSSTNEISFNKIRMNRIWTNLSSISKAFGKVTLVYYIREQAEAIETRLNQAIKSRICLSRVNINELIKNPVLNYELFQTHLSSVFSHAKIEAHNYSNLTDENKGVVTHFFNRYLGAKLNEHRTNSKFGSMFLVLIYILINEDKAKSIDQKVSMKKFLEDIPNLNEFSEGLDRKNILSSTQVEKIRQYFRILNISYFENVGIQSDFYYSFSSDDKDEIGLSRIQVAKAYRKIFKDDRPENPK
jgi:hypothetical protein